MRNNCYRRGCSISLRLSVLSSFGTRFLTTSLLPFPRYLSVSIWLPPVPISSRPLLIVSRFQFISTPSYQFLCLYFSLPLSFSSVLPLASDFIRSLVLPSLPSLFLSGWLSLSLLLLCLFVCLSVGL